MKYFTFIPVILLSFACVNALADHNTCKTIEGHIEPLTLDPDCHIRYKQPKHFPDVTFVGPPACFSGTLRATLSNDDTPVTGTFFSGVTVNGIHQLTGASALRLKVFNRDNIEVELGTMYTNDAVFLDPEVALPEIKVLAEVLAMVEGSKKLRGGQGSLEITGDAASGADFTGKLCY